MAITWDAGEGDVEITLEVLIAWIGHVERGVRYSHSAHLTTGASLMQVLDDVTRTSDESEVSLDARTDRHATVQGRGHEDDIMARADGAKLVVVTVFLAVTRRRCNRPHHHRHS